MNQAPSRATAAFEDFLFEAKAFWMRDIFPALRDEYEARAGARQVTTPEEAAALIEDTPLYQYFSWFERHIQKEKYSGRYGIIATLEAQRPQLERRLAAVQDEPNLLTLDPTIEVPAYYSDVDTHQHPGNLTGDSLAGLVYKASSASTQPGLTEAYGLHTRFAALLAERGRYSRVLDAGCGFGKSAITIAQKLPDARVEGADLAAPCLALAATEAAEAQVRNIHYRQADIRRTPYEDGAFDLVTSTMVLHEMPPEELTDFFRETYRLLEPGGAAVHLDFHTEDPFLAHIYHQHGRRNNEPYMEAVNSMDLAATLTEIGFEAPTIELFAETEAVTGERHDTWRYPWTVVSARKPA